MMVDPNQSNAEVPKSVRFGRRVDWTLAIIIIVIGIVFIYLLQSLPQRATFFPWFITISIVIVGAVYTIGKWTRPSRWDAQYLPPDGVEEGNVDTGPAYLVPYMGRIVRSMLIFMAAVVAAIMIGPKFAVPIFVTVTLIMGGENKIGALISGVGFFLVIHYVFGEVMTINLPKGVLIEMIG